MWCRVLSSNFEYSKSGSNDSLRVPVPNTCKLRMERERASLIRAVGSRLAGTNTQILTQSLYFNYYHLNPKYLIIGYMDTLGLSNCHELVPP